MRAGFSIWHKSQTSDPSFWNLALQAGFELVEIALDYPWPWERSFNNIARRALREGLDVGLHAPWRDLRLASPLRDVREGSSRAVLEAIDKVLSVGIDFHYIVLHVSSQEWIPEHMLDTYLDEVSTTLGEIRDVSRSHGFDVVIENAQTPFSDRMALLKKLAKRLDVGVCLDLGHLVLGGVRKGASKRRLFKTVTKWFNELSHLVRVVHLHGYDEDRKKPHMGLTESNIDVMAGVLSILGRMVRDKMPDEVPIVLEVFSYEDNDMASFFSKMGKELEFVKMYLKKW